MISSALTSPSQGSLTFFTGPMCCGKTLELVRNLHIFREQHLPLLCLRPSTDNRTPNVQSRNGLLQDAVAVHPEAMDEIRRHIIDVQIIGIDEVQFFSPAIIEVLLEALRQNKTILAAGLDTDFRGAMFPTSQAIMAIPETIVQRSRAVCAVCRRYNATRTQRLRNGQPVRMDDPLVLIENSKPDVWNIT